MAEQTREEQLEAKRNEFKTADANRLITTGEAMVARGQAILAALNPES